MMAAESAKFDYSVQLEDIEASVLYVAVGANAADLSRARRRAVFGASVFVCVFVAAVPTWFHWHFAHPSGMKYLVGTQVVMVFLTIGAFAISTHPHSFSWSRAEGIYKAMKTRGNLEVEVEVSGNGVRFTDSEVTVHWNWLSVLAVVPWRKGVMIECTQGSAFIPQRVLPPDATPEDVSRSLLALKPS